MADSHGLDPEQGLFGISVAAEMAGLDPQSLRLYERRGLLEPTRTAGGTRRYSLTDVARLRRIAALVADGVNLAGVGMVLSLQDDNERLSAAQGQLEQENIRLHADRDDTRR